MTFATPELLWLLLAPLALLVWELTHRRPLKCQSSTAYPGAISDGPNSKSQIQIFSTTVHCWTYSGLALAITTVSHPQICQEIPLLQSPGAPMVFALDLSVSMLAEDYTDGRVRLNRLQAIRPSIEEFIKRHPQMPIGLVVFAGSVRTLARPTVHHDYLQKILGSVKIGMLVNGTAIGDGLNAALQALPETASTPTPSHPRPAVILITDGVNNTGALRPAQATEQAVQANVTVHTIALGSVGAVRFPLFDGAGNPIGYTVAESDFDPAEVSEMARNTGGIFCQARGQQSINLAFSEIAPNPAVAAVATQTSVLMNLSPWSAALACLAFVIPARAFADRCSRSRRPPSP